MAHELSEGEQSSGDYETLELDFEDEHDEDESVFSTPTQSAAPRSSGRAVPLNSLSKKISSARHTRVRHDDFHSVSKAERYVSLYGPGRKEIVAALQCRDKWYHDQMLPHRQAEEDGRGGFRRSYFEAADDYTPEAAELWHWFFRDGGEACFQQNQHSRDLGCTEGQEYVASADGCDVRFLMGPRKRQKLSTLESRRCARVHDLWEDAERSNPLPRPGKSTKSKKVRQGWMMNAGSEVHDLAWVPWAEERTQYLTVSTTPDPLTQAGSCNSVPSESIFVDEQQDQPRSHSFAPSGPLPATIQFWAFPSDVAPEDTGKMDLSQVPEIRLVLCTNWGRVMQLKWCIAPQDQRNSDRAQDATALLAGVWADGNVRVLCLSPRLLGGSGSTRYVKVEQAAFESCPPNTVCTCVDWLTTSHIAVGCANGFVAVWDISRYLSRTSNPSTSTSAAGMTSGPPVTPPKPRPLFYYPIHQTYVLAVASCAPSHPDLLVTSAMDGYVRVTNIHSPGADQTECVRTRFGMTCLAWSDAVQCAVSGDEYNALRAIALRRFYGSVTFARLSSNVMSLAVGSMHTAILAGGADGTVDIVNPLRKLLTTKMPPYQLTWFTHEYSSRAKAAEGAGASSEDGTASGSGSGNNDSADGEASGIVRITEGYRVDAPRLLLRKGKSTSCVEGMIPATIYEERSAVTHLAWNANARCGGWAAAGMRSGLIRVEDLAI